MKFTLASIAAVLVIATASANPVLEKRTLKKHKAVGVDVGVGVGASSKHEGASSGSSSCSGGSSGGASYPSA